MNNDIAMDWEAVEGENNILFDENEFTNVDDNT